MENAASRGSGAALQLGFDVPGNVRAVVLAKNLVCNDGVGVFRVDEETVHIEDAGADRGEAGIDHMLVGKK